MNDTPSAESVAREADTTPGALLKRERERASLTVLQAAEDLHLDPWIIEAIESNRFVALGAPVYARGHLRKYAARLGLPEQEVLALYERLQDRPHEADPIPVAVVAPVRSPRISLKGPVLALLAVLVIGVLGYVAYDVFVRSPESTLQVNASTPAIDAEPATNEADAPADTSSAPEVSEEASPVPDETVTQEPEQAVVPEQPIAAATETTTSTPTIGSNVPTDAPTIRLTLEFTGESWTEVYDANGTRLLFGMGTPQRARTLSGVPPIQVILGAASAVNLQVNGEPTVIPRREGREATRFTIDADGNLR